MNQESGPTVFGMFVKQPVAGQVKTRLAADLGHLGDESAAMLYGAFQRDLVERFRGRFGRRILGFAPAQSAGFFEQLARDDYQLWAQPDVELGDRMRLFFEMSFAAGAGRVVLIGSDSPTLPVRMVDAAFEALVTHDLVLGPATDGGYVLIGQSATMRNVFDDIPWSSHNVLALTIMHAQRQSLSVDMLNPWYDVDTIADLLTLQGQIRVMDVSGQSQKLEATRQALINLNLPRD